jgi:S-formylglutathione hydrolase FrmB
VTNFDLSLLLKNHRLTNTKTFVFGFSYGGGGAVHFNTKPRNLSNLISIEIWNTAHPDMDM